MICNDLDLFLYFFEIFFLFFDYLNNGQHFLFEDFIVLFCLIHDS